jgi:hypothetical protein
LNPDFQDSKDFQDSSITGQPPTGPEERPFPISWSSSAKGTAKTSPGAFLVVKTGKG